MTLLKPKRPRYSNEVKSRRDGGGTPSASVSLAFILWLQVILPIEYSLLATRQASTSQQHRAPRTCVVIGWQQANHIRLEHFGGQDRVFAQAAERFKDGLQ